jgi:hypothetical protein
MFEQDPRASIHSTSQRLAISRSTVHKILKLKLKKKCYHIQVLHELHDEDYPRWAAMCADSVEQIQNENLMEHILFSDEATFHTLGSQSTQLLHLGY